MRNEKEIRALIERTKTDYKHILTGEFSNIQTNAPRALMQLDVESRLQALHWTLGTTYKSKLKSR